MANSYGTLNGTLVVQATIDTLLAKFPFLMDITHDFSDAPILYKQTATSRVAIPHGDAKDFDPAVGYTASDVKTVDVPVTMDNWIHDTYAVTGAEASSTNRDLIQEQANNSAYAIGNTLAKRIFAKVKAATFPQAYPVTAVGMNRGAANSMRGQLNKLGVPDIGRVLILNSDYYAALGADITVVGNLYNRNSGDSIQEGTLPRVGGFQPSEYPIMADQGENLMGVAGNKEALILTTRLPVNPAPAGVPIPGRIETVKDARTGFAFQLREYYDMILDRFTRSVVVLAGFSVGFSEQDAGGVSTTSRLLRITKP